MSEAKLSLGCRIAVGNRPHTPRADSRHPFRVSRHMVGSTGVSASSQSPAQLSSVADFDKGLGIGRLAHLGAIAPFLR